MPRIKIELPQKFSFSRSLSVRITDINYGGHVGNDAMLSLMHEARMQFLKHHGYTEMQIGGASLIMSDVAIEFKAEAFYDDVLVVFVTAGDFTRVGFDLYYKITKEDSEKIIVIANAKTGMVCYDYNAKKVVAVPEEVRNRLS